MMFNQRTNHVYRKMREIVQSGEMGRIRRTNWIITNWYRPQCYYDSGAWRATWSGEGGGVLLQPVPPQPGSVAVDLRHARPGGCPTCTSENGTTSRSRTT